MIAYPSGHLLSFIKCPFDVPYIFKGSGTHGTSEADSLVFQHVNAPYWDELFWIHFQSPVSLDLYSDKWLLIQLFHIGGM